MSFDERLLNELFSEFKVTEEWINSSKKLAEKYEKTADRLLVALRLITKLMLNHRHIVMEHCTDEEINAICGKEMK